MPQSHKDCMDFEIGDRVICKSSIRTYVGELRSGDTGTVRIRDKKRIGIEWDNNVGGHDLQHLCKDGHGWFFFANYIPLIDDIEVIPKHDESPDLFEESDEMEEFLSQIKKKV